MNRFFTAAIILIVFSIELHSQFISNKGRTDEPYLNYSGRNYENYSTAFIRKKFFDNFGNFLVEGTTVFELNEVQRAVTGNELYTFGGASNVLKSRYYQNYFNNLVIGKDAYSGFQTRLMVGDAIRTKFTDLTLNRARFNGIRWDAGTSKYRGTVVATRVSDPIRFSFETGFYSDGVRRIRDWTQYLFGGHFEADLGDIATVGITYVNQHQRKSSIDSKEASLQGVVTNVIPRVIYLRIRDDSPGDNMGPVVFAPPSLIVNGALTPTTPLYGSGNKAIYPTDANTQLGKPIQYYVLRKKEENRGFDIDNAYYTGVDTTSWTNYKAMIAKFADSPPSYPYVVPGTAKESITYAYIMPAGVSSVQFQITLANDYMIETAEDYLNIADSYSSAEQKFVSHSDTNYIAIPTPFFVRERAEGNVHDGSNKKVVIVNYGLTSGMSVYGLNFNLKWNGFELSGEYEESCEFLKYPLLAGNRFESKGKAWFLKGKKNLGRFTLGGETFFIAPTYRTYLNTFVLDNSYYGTRDNPIAPDYSGYDGSYSSIARYYPSNIAGGAFFPLVDDNDDNDRWEDGFYYYNVQPMSGDLYMRNGDVINKNGDYYKLGYRQNRNELQDLNAITRKPDSGIFPGKDKDNDGIPDDDRNANGIPDYSEDFLTFYSDPPSFDYGDDWNNNRVIDDQENDIYPDYPYEPDLKGYHIFGSLEILKGLSFTLGKIDQKAIARGGKNEVNYFKAFFNTASPKFGSLVAYYVLKRVKDNIQNDGYQFQGVITTANPFPTWTEDSLFYRNSLVNSLYIGTKYTQIKDLCIENNIRYEFNNQFSIGTRSRSFLPEARLLGDQVSGSVTYYGIVNKIDYTYRLLNNTLKLSPQFKIRTEKEIRYSEDKTRTKVVTISKSTQELIPIFRIDYSLTESTDLRFGLQGFTLFNLSDMFTYRVRNFKDHKDEQDRSTMAVSLSNRSTFGGYNIVLDFGYKYTNIKYLRPEDSGKGTQESTLFFTVFAGL